LKSIKDTIKKQQVAEKSIFHALKKYKMCELYKLKPKLCNFCGIGGPTFIA
jgi:hypothetical protein